ncbi:asparagine synthetase B [Candidatus Bathyarchaeota archaeon]|nr:asparagine synthetase B [Candidatus Bathyarchaeota archaeon]
MGAIIAVVSKKGENAIDTAIFMLSMLAHGNVNSLGIASATTVSTEKKITTLQNQDARSPVIVGHVFSQIFPHDKPQPIKLGNAALVFEGRAYSNKTGISDAEVVAKKLARKEPIEKLIKKLEGSYTFAVAEPEKIVAGRDVVGIYPFYYGENRSFAALASERKALWRIGIKTVNPFPLGHLVLVDRNGFKFKPAKTLIYSKSKQTTIEAAAQKLQKLLQHSVKEKVYGLKEVAVAFSGGLDSSLIAFLAKKLGVNVRLIHVSLENQCETQYAQEAAEELNLPICTYLFREKDVETVIPKVLWLIEEPDSVKVGVGIPFYWTAEKAVEMNLKVLLAGQGADELFGGYKRYISEYLRYGGEKARRTICNDILKMHETNFERDFKICNFHNVELRLPFATFQIAKFAMELPIELKMERKENGLRKLVLRQVARNLSLPQFIVEKPKKAIQYATGVNKVLKKLATQKGLSVKEYLQKTFQTFFKEAESDE